MNLARTTNRAVVLGGLVGAAVLAPQALAQTSVEDLQRQIEQLEERLEALETSEQGEAAEVQSRPVPRAEQVMETEQGQDLSQAVPGAERMEQSEEQDASDEVAVGGALRFNVVHRDFVEASQSKKGESGLDIFRLNVDGEIDNIIVSAEYRFYSYMHTIHHGWIGYEFEDASQVQFGIHQVPFGLLPYAAHNAWFGVPYYVGLADDYDMGIKYVRQDGPWTTHLAFYKNEELNDASDLGRYSFDLVRVDQHQNEETNRGNARLSYTFGAETDCETQLGVSVQRGQVYNAESDMRGSHWAAAAHADVRCGRWNFQLQGTSYDYDLPRSLNEAGDRAVRMGAFATSYDVASEADVVVANVAYNFASPWRRVDEIICYNDYSRLLKGQNGRDSQINTTGCAIGSGPLFSYVDLILANNMPFFGNGSLSNNGEDEWHGRLNINIGFYW